MPIGPLRTGNEPFFYESWFNLVGNDSQHLVRRFPNERFAQNCVRKSIHSGGGFVMAWGHVTYKAQVHLSFLIRL